MLLSMFACTTECRALNRRGRNQLGGSLSIWRFSGLAIGIFFCGSLQGAAPASNATASGSATSSVSGGTAAHGNAAASGTATRSAENEPESVEIDRTDFSMKYPVGWSEPKDAKDYDANANFTLFSPKNSSLQFIIMNKADDPKKVVDSAVKKIDGVQITTLSRSNLSEWQKHKGVGQYLKGKIVDSFPGGIKVFCFSSAKHNVLVIETTFSDDLKDTQADIQFIGESIKMKN